MSDVTYVGTVGALIEKKSGWYTIEIAIPGKQWPVKADTKLEHLISQARELRDAGAVATFTVREEESENINPKNGLPYMERRLQKMEAGATSENAANANVSPSSGSQDAMTKEEWAAKDSAIHHIAAIKAAADALKHTIPSEPTKDDLNIFSANVLHLARGWHRVVLGTRDDPQQDGIPFEGARLSAHDEEIGYPE